MHAPHGKIWSVAGVGRVERCNCGGLNDVDTEEKGNTGMQQFQSNELHSVRELHRNPHHEHQQGEDQHGAGTCMYWYAHT
eukprot:10114055-Prorocentrum_lima.AAC.1